MVGVGDATYVITISSVLPSTEHVAVFFFCLSRVLELFGLYATLIFSLIIIIIIIHTYIHTYFNSWEDRLYDYDRHSRNEMKQIECSLDCLYRLIHCAISNQKL